MTNITQLIEKHNNDKEGYTLFKNSQGIQSLVQYKTNKLDLVPDKHFDREEYTKAIPFYTTKIFKFSPIEFKTLHHTVDYVYKKTETGKKPTLVSKIHTGEVTIEYYTQFNPFL
jgi:hypothetical protein